MKGLARKKELILERERFFANAVGSAVFEQPRISLWMILVPILFLHFIYRMQKYKNGRLKFDEEFMATRRRAVDVAVDAVVTGVNPNIDHVVRDLGLRAALERPYAAWMRTLVEFYMDLLRSNGDSFDSLVRSAFRNRGNFLLTLNRLNTVEKDFYEALKPQLASTEGAADIIATIIPHSQRLRRELAQQIFP
ncbi:MAG: NF038143 family protein [Desulfobacterales bacterium]|nr:NF038143 family protein [Desulfobacterales bacterium]